MQVLVESAVSGEILQQITLAWVLHQPGVTGAICGTLSAANARRNSAAGDIALDPAMVAEAGELFTSGAGRPA